MKSGFIEKPPKVPSHIDIIKDFPYWVSYPRAGKDLLLIKWWTTYERGVLGLLKPSFIRRYLNLVLERHPTAEIKELYRVDRIVHPGKALHEAYATGQLQSQWRTFQFRLAEGLAMKEERGLPLPKGVSKCTKMVLKKGFEPNEFWDSKHHACRNCDRQYVIPAELKIRLFWKNGYEPDTQHEAPPWAVKTLLPSIIRPEVPMATPQKTVWVCKEDFGHHSEGVAVEKAGAKWAPGTNVKFFFHGRKLDIPKWMSIACKAAQKEDERRIKEADVLREEAHEASKSEHFKRYERLFEE